MRDANTERDDSADKVGRAVSTVVIVLLAALFAYAYVGRLFFD